MVARGRKTNSKLWEGWYFEDINKISMIENRKGVRRVIDPTTLQYKIGDSCTI